MSSGQRRIRRSRRHGPRHGPQPAQGRHCCRRSGIARRPVPMNWRRELGVSQRAKPGRARPRLQHRRALRLGRCRRARRSSMRSRRDCVPARSSSIARRSAPTPRATRGAPTVPRKAANFVDAPVSGGVEGARDGTLAIMAGGTPKRLRRGTARAAGDGSDTSPISDRAVRAGRQGDQPDHVRRGHPGRGRGDGVRQGAGPAVARS